MVSCTKPDDIDTTIPQIEFAGYTRTFFNQNSDSFTFSINFSDGDGDIGLGQLDTFPPYRAGTEFFSNLYLEYLEKVDGEFVKVAPIFTTDTIEYAYRIPRLSSEGRDKSMKGTIDVGVLLDQPPIKSSVLKFRIFLYDRALHKSNVVETPEITR